MDLNAQLRRNVRTFYAWIGSFDLRLDWIVRRSDEFARRIHLVAIALAAMAGLVLLIALNWLVRARFVDPPDLMLLWVAFLVFWLIAMLATKAYYERTR
jgi:hypothetical protein